MKKITIIIGLILMYLFLNGCTAQVDHPVVESPDTFSPTSMTIEGDANGLLNEEYAQKFCRQILLASTAVAEETSFSSEYTVCLMEDPGEERETATVEFSLKDMLLRFNGKRYRIPESGKPLLTEITHSEDFIGPDITGSFLADDTPMIVTAIYESFIYAKLPDEPQKTVKLNFPSTGSSDQFDYNLGDKISGSVHAVRIEGDHIEGTISEMLTDAQKEALENIPTFVY
ncbi:MAG: hypothetical protein IJ043_05765 [Clostridia bacterium]|nr:hypothetical protein [Clostridia bacterium]